MRIAAISDIHGNLPAIPECDLLLIAGDVCELRDHSLPAQTQFLNGSFRRWLESIPAKQVVGIAGNHDFLFELGPELIPRGLRWTYLQDASATIDGLRIYGTPWQPVFFDWAFNLTEPKLAEKWDAIPDDTDVLICHGPPFGFGDRAFDGRRTGSPSLTKRVEAIAPRLIVCGHIHEDRGTYTLPTKREGGTIVANVSHLDGNFRPSNEAMIFDL